MINKRVIGSELIIVEIEIMIRVQETVENIIKLGIIARDKNSFEQIIKDQVILW